MSDGNRAEGGSDNNVVPFRKKKVEARVVDIVMTCPCGVALTAKPGDVVKCDDCGFTLGLGSGS